MRAEPGRENSPQSPCAGAGTLAAQQQALLATLFEWPRRDGASRGMLAYQANGHYLAERALANAYPVLQQLLGAESFAALARAHWHAHPPARGDLGQWGAELTGFIERSAQLEAEPYLPDVARAEWKMHGLATAADAMADLASFARLAVEDPAELKLSLRPDFHLLASAFPVVSIVLAHASGNDDAEGEGEGDDENSRPHASMRLQLLGQMLRAGTPQTALIWRQNLRPRIREALAGEGAFLAALQSGQPLAAALDAAPLLDFGHWLPLAAQTGLLLGVA